MALLTQRTLALSADTDDLIHIVKTDDFSQSPFGSSYKATLGQVLALVPSSSGYTQVQDEGVDITQSDTLNFVGSGVTVTDVAGVTTVNIPGGALGGILMLKSLNGYTFTGDETKRAVISGTSFNNYTYLENWGSVSLSSFNPTSGVWTCPKTGWYDFSLLFSLSIASDNNNPPPGTSTNQLTSVTNPLGFVGSNTLSDPDSTWTSPGTLDFKNFFGKFIVAITETDGDVIVCSNSYAVDYNTSQIIISASYTNRKCVVGNTYHVRWLYTCKNDVEAVSGNSIHFTVTHLGG